MRRKVKKQQKNPPSTQPFERMWKATDSPQEYDSLVDEHSSYYFASPTLQKHIIHLNKVMGKENKSSENLKVAQNIHRSRIHIRRSLGVHESSKCMKVVPYSLGLKSCSKSKLEEFKRNLEASLKIKQKEHLHFLRTSWNTKKPDRPAIRLVRTLAPLEKILEERGSGCRKKPQGRKRPVYTEHVRSPQP